MRSALRGCALAAGMLLAAWPMAAQELDAGVTLQAARGRFIFEDATTSWMLLSAVTVQAAAWRLGITLPGIYQNSSAVSYIGGVPTGTGGPNGGTVAGRGSGERIPGRRRGGNGGTMGIALALVDSGYVEAPGAYRFTLGDPMLSVGRDVWSSGAGALRIGFQGLAKLPLAPVSSGVGTGAADVGAALAGTVSIGTAMVAVDLSHWIIGDLPDLPLRDVSGVSVAAGRVFGWTRRHSAVVSYSASTAAVARSDAPQSVVLTYGFLNDGGRSISVGVARGLSESTAEWTAWVGWRRPIGAAGRNDGGSSP